MPERQMVFLVRLWYSYHGEIREVFSTETMAKEYCDARRDFSGEWVKDGDGWMKGDWTITPMTVDGATE